jgi:hypothetical protein
VIPHLNAARVGIEEIQSVLRVAGVVVLDGALSPYALARLRGELDPWFARASTGEGAFFGVNTRRFSGLFAKSQAMAEVALHPLALGAIETLLGGSPEAPRCDSIELNLTQAISIGPGEAPQFLHRDEELWPHRFPFEIMANVMVAIDDFTAENGATRLIPGSQHWDRTREPAPGEALPAIAPAGSMILWLGGVLHAGGANRTEVARRGVVVSYRLGWIAPAEKLLLSTPPDTARRLPRRLQQLIGYQLHRPNLGWIEGRDPIEWLNGDVNQLAAAGDNLTPAHEAMLGEIARQPERFAGYLT